MVEAIPFGTAADILMKLGSSTFRELGFIYGVNKEMKKLENTPLHHQSGSLRRGGEAREEPSGPGLDQEAQ
ncbi:hypothetical protein M0R45_020796 [Rubus argutus]|uniref:Uncharacterized protein n=1 Tax=Rubus argutus TaxID=59490 RepID=A0AAW1XAK9_RUBAR